MTDVIDPSKLTKEQLYQALIEHGVTDIPTKRARKQEFAFLYNKHIVASETERTDGNLSFVDDKQVWDDEEIEFVDKSQSNKRRPNSIMPPVRKSEAPAEVKLMSNAELTAQLRAHGVDVGPIIATTRKVYERKLGELLTGGPPPQASASEDEEEDMEDETYEEEEFIQEEPEIVPKSSGFQSSSIRQRPHIREGYSERESSYTSQSYTSSKTGVASPQSPQAPPKKGMSLIVKLLILVILVVLVYLVVVNMEGTRPKPQALTDDPEAAGQSPT